TAGKLQDRAAEDASGLPLNLGERVPVRTRATVAAEPTFGRFEPIGTDVAGPQGFSPDHLEMLRCLRASGYSQEAALKIAGQDLKAPALAALRKTIGMRTIAPRTAASAAPITVDPAGSLQRLFNLPSDAEVDAAIANRNMAGRWK